MVDSGKEISREQNHYGSGPLIGGHNYGPISYEMLDQRTRSCWRSCPRKLLSWLLS